MRHRCATGRAYGHGARTHPAWRRSARPAGNRYGFGCSITESSRSSFRDLRVTADRELSELVEQLELQATSGSSVSRERVGAIECAQAQPFLPGDPAPRASGTSPLAGTRRTRTGAEPGCDPVLDTFADVREEPADTLNLGVRARHRSPPPSWPARIELGSSGSAGCATPIVPGLDGRAAVPDRRRPYGQGGGVQLPTRGRAHRAQALAARRRRS
jgi:hypothetical protein